MPDDCGHPQPILPDPPGSTPEQQIENLEAYIKYLQCLLGAPDGDCKRKSECRRQYEFQHGAIYPPTQ